MEENNPQQNKTGKKSPYVALVYILALMFSSVVCYKGFSSEVQFDFSFNDLLALFISLFAIGLSMAFYFKTTETSNRFYDNAHRFTTDINTTLSGIESGFREKLQHIKEGNRSIEDKIDDLTKVKEGVGKIDEAIIERKGIIKEFAIKNNAKTEEIEKLLSQLAEKDEEIFRQQSKVTSLMAEIEKADIATNRIVQIEKISELDNALLPNNIEVGFSKRGSFIREPKVGERFWIGTGFRTSPVQEIIDENTFKTEDSIYKWFCVNNSACTP